MKSANWISAIGMRPFSAAPTATPTMPDSASGVSSTRASPNRAYSPSVAPSTPPLRPPAYFPTLRNPVARKVGRLGRAVGHMEAKYQAVKTRKRVSLFVELTLPAGLEPAFTQAATRAMPDAACDRKAMLRGLFLGCGSVHAPRSRYHPEFVAPEQSVAQTSGAMAA